MQHETALLRAGKIIAYMYCRQFRPFKRRNQKVCSGGCHHKQPVYLAVMAECAAELADAGIAADAADATDATDAADAADSMVQVADCSDGPCRRLLGRGKGNGHAAGNLARVAAATATATAAARTWQARWPRRRRSSGSSSKPRARGQAVS